MSYLDTPRVHFTGTFVANPSTINNTPDNYLPASYQQIKDDLNQFNAQYEAWKKDPQQNPPPNQSTKTLNWNPNGKGVFQIKSCTIQSFIGHDGTRHDAGNSDDPLIGATLESFNGPSGMPGKLVDLDTDLQVHTRLYGLYLKLRFKGSTTPVINGHFLDTAPLINLWMKRIPSGSGDSAAGGVWQSVLQNLTWDVALWQSSFLQQLWQASRDSLSIRITLFDYDDKISNSTFTHGNLVGTIGPQDATEPTHFAATRFLIPLHKDSSMFYAPAKVLREVGRLTIDLGNSIPGQQQVVVPPLPGEPPGLTKPTYWPNDLGTMKVEVSNLYGHPLTLGEVPYKEQYYACAGVFDLDLGHLTSQQWQQLKSNPLRILTSSPTSILQLGERDDGIYIEADQPTHYLEPGEPKTVQLYVRRFGQPLVGHTVPLKLMPGPNDKTGTPVNGVSFPVSVVSDQLGRAEFAVTASEIKPNAVPVLRAAIRSQLYFIGSDEWKPGNDSYAPITVKVFLSQKPLPENPTWDRDVSTILQQYYYLYPVMSVYLQDYETIKKHASVIQGVLMHSRSDALHMPVTRDLSQDDLTVIMRWFQKGTPK